MPRTVYLDHAATTPLDPDVFDAMRSHFTESFGNASSVHTLGRQARFAVEECRERIADLLGAEPGEIIFTSGGSESDNLALHGLLAGRDRDGLITSAVEHEAVLKPAERRRAAGLPVRILVPGSTGAVTADAVAEAIDARTGLVSLMHTNNELGTRTDLAAVSAVCRERDVLLHTDAVQAAEWCPLDVNAPHVDALSLSAHKLYGPKGVGLLYVRGGVPFVPLIAGGAQERKRRAGTENVPGIVGLTAALVKAQQNAEATRTRFAALQQRMVDALDAHLAGEYVLNTPLSNAAPHIVNLSFPPHAGAALDAEMLLLNLDMAGVYASSGSACTSGALEPSHVQQALGKDPATARATVRFSLGHATTDADVDYAVEQLAATVRRMRKLAAV